MSQQLLKRIEEFRKQQKLPILTLCKMMDVHNVTYHRWKNAGKITGAYNKIVEDFLAKQDKSTSSNASDIAIIGIACYYPGASNKLELWENILARRVQFRRMLDQRLPLSEYYDEDPKTPEKTYLTKAAFLENFKFDWGKLRIPKKTVESTDIAHWLALDIALKTFEDAGFDPNDIPLQNTGVIVGNTLTGEQTRSQTLRLRWPYVQKVLNATLGHLGKNLEERSQIATEMEKIYKSAFYPVTEDSLAGGLANTIAGRICNYLNLKGGGYIVDGACSSSLLAVATAADALKMGNLDLALAGGVDISLDPFELVGFSKAGALAKDQMRVYDQKANGFLPGEGCGFVLLKRLKDAIRDKNYVYAVIKGWGISSDGKGGIMEPSSSGQSFAIGRAYKDLDYKISDVDFVEGHGTGTTKGDRVELEGIAAAIDKTIKSENKDRRSCGVTSFKSIVGHTKAAAGIGGLIKAVMAVNQHILPPTATCTQPNDVFKDKAKNLYPIILGGRLPQDRKVRAGISSAGFGGINCHVTVESQDEPKKELTPKLDERSLFVSQQETEVFIFTSRNTAHLKKLIHRFKEDLRNISIAEMADLASFLNNKVRGPLRIKVAIVTDTPEHLYEALIQLENEIDLLPEKDGAIYRIKPKDLATHIILSCGVQKSRIGFLFPGQGSQRLNMTRTLVHRYRWARDLFKLSDLPLFEKVYQATDKYFTKEDQEEFIKQLADTRITQPAIVLSSIIWLEFFSKLGIEPQVCVGHSLGELTAFYKAGAFNKETLIKFAQFRGELMAADSRLSGTMVSLLCSQDKAQELIERVSGNIVVANINSPNQTVVSGGKKEIEKIKELAGKENVPAYQLNVSNAFHSSFMNEASHKILESRILPESFKSKDIKVYSCMNGAVVSGRVDLKDYFSKQVISPVNFVGVVESASKECDLMIEIGPGKVLTELVKATNKDILSLPVESTIGNDRDLNIVLAEIFIRDVRIKWEELYRNRLIRAFVPVSKKKFIENQCEHPLKIDQQVLTNKFAPILLKANEDVVKPKESEVIIPGGLPEVKGKNYIENLLINLTQKITGFDLDTISLNLMLLDDLNLDSIKAAELIGQAARALGIAGLVDPSKLSNNTLEQIADRLYVLSIQAASGSAKESVNDILKRYQDKRWVRDFKVNLIPEEIKSRNVNQLKDLKNVAILLEKGQEVFVGPIEDQFKALKAKTQKIYFGDNEAQPEKFNFINCLITMLPKSISQDISKDSLRSTIERLHQITDLATSNRLDKGSFVVFVQFGGGATAVASTLFLERPDLRVRVINFDANADEGVVSQRIIDELQTYEDFSVVEYDQELKRRVVYYENSNPFEYKKRDIRWSSKDVVLVTGGAKGITAQCALEFARSTKAHMILVGRSPVPSGTLSSPNVLVGDLEIIQTLKQFADEGLKCAYYSCDVTNEKDVQKTIAAIEQKFGNITGVVHGAGLNSIKRLKQSSIKEAYQEALPKVMGAVNICRALEAHPPKLIAGITSIIGITGMDGSGWYGLANELLNIYLGQFSKRHTSTQVVAIAYSVWDEVGMGAKLGSVNRLAEKGIGAIPVKDGIRHFKQLIETDPGVQQVIVAARVAGIATWRSIEPKKNNFRFIEKLEYILPGVELIARANLNVTDDPYLLDHNWKGSLLFPFVFGFEAMAQAVACVLGVDKFDHIIAKDIDLQRPIPVAEESGMTIEIHAHVLEQERMNVNTQVKVEIYSQDTAYNEPHFSALFEMALAPVLVDVTKESVLKNAEEAIDIDVSTDIYGPILFQGKMFQCIEKIHELYYDQKMNKGECVFTSLYNKTAEEFLKKNKKFNKRFLIGDPFFLDSMLQSMQVIIPQDVSLPRDIQEIELGMLNKVINAKCSLSSKIKRIDTDYYRGDSEVLRGNSMISIKNCRLKVLDTNLNNPTANDLVNPAKRDQRLIENKLVELSKELNFVVPVVKCHYDERLKNASKELRHKIELPIIKEAVKELCEREQITIKDLEVKWLNSGKPIVNLNGVGVSVSHRGSILIVIAGMGDQACDIEIINNRRNDVWLEILGVDLYKIFEKTNNEYDKDFIGTSIWSLKEIIAKSNNENDNNYLIEKIVKDCVVYKTNFNSFVNIVSLRFDSLNKYSSVITLLVFKKESLSQLNDVNSLLNKAGYNKEVFRLKFELSGPQGQPVYTQRFPVTFKNTQNLSKNVYFSNYFDWIGEVREYGLYPIKQQLIRLFETGNWGMATNHVKLRILGELKSDDIVEGKLWLNRISGNKESVLDLIFDWFKLLPDGNLERIAISEQRVSWIKIIGHGEGRIESFPEEISKFIHLLSPKRNETDCYKIDHSAPYLNIGKKIIRKNSKSNLLSHDLYTTSLEESNLVGNIYFSNYAKWLGKTRDAYFREIIPDYYFNTGEKGEFICSNCDVFHLSEAMPFDSIRVRMYLNEIYENGMDLYFEFFKDTDSQNLKRLTYATHRVIFCRKMDGKLIENPIPDDVMAAIL